MDFAYAALGGNTLMFVRKDRPLWLSLWLVATLFLVQGCKEEPLATVKSRAPDFTLELFEGGTVSLQDYKGHPVILNFFASWCVPCGEEAPAFEAGYQEFQAKGVRFVGVASQDTHSKAKAFVEKHGLTYPSGLDARGVIREAYGVFGMPTTFFIDKEGLIHYLHVGGVTKELMRYELEKIL